VSAHQIVHWKLAEALEPKEEKEEEPEPSAEPEKSEA
jgi:hypothetical protein